MTGRDRLVLIGILTIAVLGGAWVIAVSPQRSKATKASAEVSVARAKLATAEGVASSARGAQAEYSAAYASIVSLGKAVPPTPEVPSLIYQLAQVSGHKNVEFASITTTESAGGSAPAAGASAVTAMPFTFIFNGTFNDLYKLFQGLNNFTVSTAKGTLRVRGRLLTIQSAKLGASSAVADKTSGPPRLTGTITATAYVLPAAQSLTGGATASSPAAAATPASSTTAAPTAPTAPAVAKANP